MFFELSLEIVEIAHNSELLLVFTFLHVLFLHMQVGSIYQRVLIYTKLKCDILTLLVPELPHELFVDRVEAELEVRALH